MRRFLKRSQAIVLCLSVMPIGQALAREQDLPCNDLCRWWLGRPNEPPKAEPPPSPTFEKLASPSTQPREPTRKPSKPLKVVKGTQSHTATLPPKKKPTPIVQTARPVARPAPVREASLPAPPARIADTPSRGGFPSGIPVETSSAVPDSKPELHDGADWEAAALRIFQGSADVKAPINP